ncbi:unnamed protein product [Gongylonema pulchrum]|uniref:Uncharacterized protein n=1 Tax=Gongylonema pulchrum TaxID=637853 RepID=A0A183DX00_9BILA|nr:unnamed protein product [Gongylonema pulchrum]
MDPVNVICGAAEPSEITFIYDWLVPIFRPINECVTAVRSVTTFSAMDSFRVPRDSEFVESLTQCFTDQANSGKTIIITVDLMFTAESFNLNFNSWMSTVPSPPADTANDFRFKVLVFMITGTFEMPQNLTPELARELIDIAIHFKPLNRDALRNTLHRALCELLIQTPNTDHRALYERLRRSGFLLTVSPLSRIDSIRRQSLKCRRVFRYGRKPDQDLNNMQENPSENVWNDVD